MENSASVAPATGGSSRERIAAEHAALRGSLEQLLEITDPHQLVSALEELRPRLAEHFAAEEGTDGLHDVIGDSAPHLLSSLQRVYDEHRQFLATVDRLTADARRCCQGPVAELLSGTRQLCDGLHEHEALESELLTDAVYTDLGNSS